MEKSSVELAKNRLILGQFYSTLLSLHLPQSKWTINWKKKIRIGINLQTSFQGNNNNNNNKTISENCFSV